MIKKKQLIEKIYILFLMLMGLFQGYIEISVLWNGGLIMLTILLFMSSRQVRMAMRYRVSAFFVVALFVGMIGLNILETQHTTYITYNFIQVFRPILIMYSVYLISTEEQNVIYDVFEKCFWFLNIMWMVNLFVLGLQVAGTGFMIKDSWLALNSYYADNCTGLFGASATHVVTIFTAFMVIYNLEMARVKIHSKISRIIFIIYIICTVLLMLFFSTLNDNNAMFVILPLMLVVYWGAGLKIQKKTVFTKVRKVLFPLLFAIICLKLVPSLKSFFLNEVLEKINGVVNFQDTNQLGSVERLMIVEEALSSGFGWRLGKGIGSWSIIDENYAGFSHFGLSSIGSFVYLIGIWGYLIVCIVHAFFLSKISGIKKKTYFVVCLGVVIILSVYTMYYTHAVSVIWTLFTFSFIYRLNPEEMRNYAE